MKRTSLQTQLVPICRESKICASKIHMKTNSIFVIVVILFLTSCSNYMDFTPPPTHIKIYKTKADYSEYVNLWGKPQEHPYELLGRLNFDNNDTIFLYRWELEQGYIAESCEIWHTDYFTNITFKEMYRHGRFSSDSLKARIIDKNPFVEFYVDDKDSFCRIPKVEVIDKLNEVIRNGEMEKYLNRLK